jgi:hypothetical protein
MKSRTSQDLELDFHARGEVAAYPDAVALMCDFVRRLAFLSQLQPESSGTERAIKFALSLLEEGDDRLTHAVISTMAALVCATELDPAQPGELMTHRSVEARVRRL